VADDLEESVGALLVDGEVSELVNDEDARLQIFFHFAFEATGGLCGGQGVDDIDRAGEEHGVAVWAGGVSEGDAEVRFAETDVADEDDVGIFFDECQTEEILNLQAVDFLRPGPVEPLKGLEAREVSCLDPVLDRLSQSVGHLSGLSVYARSTAAINFQESDRDADFSLG
jgi:hypothetical protein